MKMNSFLKMSIFPSVLTLCVLTACVGTPESANARGIADPSRNNQTEATTPEFTVIRDKDWNLKEVQLKSGNIIIDRNKTAELGMGIIYTLRFEVGRVGGTGAPNLFNGPYTLTDKQGITIGNMAATLMAPLFEPEGLKEQEYFSYLHNTTKWNIVDGNLELHTKGNDGAEAVLVFVPSVL
jgi:heat shock protein HslJ